MADDSENSIRQNADGPSRARGDSGEMEQRSLSEQIEADRYLNSNQAIKKGLGVRMSKLVPLGMS